ncbi:MAG: hypothetical protein ABSA17_05285 [Rhabdochlamydiaceae bacterium]|jgi:hypothetical protein
MSLSQISFLTPVKFSDLPTTTWHQKMTGIVDAYFNLRGRVAVAVPNQMQNGSQGVRLYTEPVIWWQSLLKIMSYGAYFLNRAATAQFPSLSANRTIVQFQTILNYLPVCMLIAKVVLRLTAKYHDCDTAKAEAASKSIMKLIPPQVEKTLDNLFGGEESVKELPTFQEALVDLWPSIADMRAPIMKGIVKSKKGAPKPFIALRMRCQTSREDLLKKLGVLEYLVPSSTIEEVFILFQYRTDIPLMWDQQRGGTPIVYPAFFDGSFTYSEDGGVTSYQTHSFQKAKEMIQARSGVDIKGIHWEIF